MTEEENLQIYLRGIINEQPPSRDMNWRVAMNWGRYELPRKLSHHPVERISGTIGDVIDPDQLINLYCDQIDF